MLHPPSLDEEQLLKSPVPASKITSQRRKWNKQANKLKRETAAFCDEVLWTREKKVLANSSCPSLSDLGKAPAGRLGKDVFSLLLSILFICFFLSLHGSGDNKSEKQGLQVLPRAWISPGS